MGGVSAGERATRREQVLAATIRVVAEQGPRGLTHRAVDRAAGVPVGTTSNFFSSRRELVLAALDTIRTSASDHFEAARSSTPSGSVGPVRELISWFTEVTYVKLGPDRETTLAWFRIAQEASGDPELQEVVSRERDEFALPCITLLEAAGSADPVRDARLVVTLITGLLVRQFYDPTPGFDPEGSVRALLRGLLPGSGSS